MVPPRRLKLHMGRKVVFLHLPKTAGQSVDSFLQSLFPAEAVCPAKVNEQLMRLSVPEIRKYSLFSGHLDWSMLDCVGADAFVFTMLRRPIDRVLSFYYFLRAQAAALTPEILDRPDQQGLKAALMLSSDDFFTGGPPHIRVFIDNHCDNFYTYYFAGRSYDARQRFGLPDHRAGSACGEALLDLALENLGTLSGVFTVQTFGSLERAVTDFLARGGPSLRLADIRLNVGSSVARARWDGLRDLGATGKTYDRIMEMVALDDVIWRRISDRPASPEA